MGQGSRHMPRLKAAHNLLPPFTMDTQFALKVLSLVRCWRPRGRRGLLESVLRRLSRRSWGDELLDRLRLDCLLRIE